MRIMIKGGVWKNTEDEILKAAVMKYGKNQWARISSLLVRKSAKQCKARWYEWLDPSIKKWRTIAPIVGRTPSQCLERYEKLLDAACVKDENYEPGDDPRKLRPGEIDPNPESKPARPDPRTTKGKKAKRKAREKQLEEARRLASLQKKRELKAAGIDVRHRRRKRKGIDYNAEIPFEKRPPPGFFDVADEDRPVEQPQFPTTIEELEGKRRIDVETQLRKQDIAKNKIAQRQDAPSAILHANKLNDPETVRKQTKLMLPPPQISDQELDEIARMGYANDLAGSDEFGEGSAATRALLANYAQTPGRGMTPLRTPQRSPASKGDATPLLGGENPELHPSDFTGVTPKRKEVQTPNPMLTPSATPGVAGLTPRIGMTPARDGYASMTPKGTPLRDELHINEDVDMHERAKLELQRAEIRRSLRSGLGSLPQPKNEDAEEPEEKIEEDMSDRIAREMAEEEARQQALLRKRSKVLQRELPRPPAASLELIRNSVIRADGDKSSFVPPTSIEQADEMIRRELLALLEHDNAKYPLDEKVNKEKKKGAKRVADKLIKDEAHYLRVALGHESEPLEEFIEAHRTGLNDLMFFPTRNAYGLSSVAGNMEKLAALQNEFENVRKKLDQGKEKVVKLEKKAILLTQGYEMRAKNSLWPQIEATSKQMDIAATELECFEALQKQEKLAASHRINNLWEEVQKQKELERTLQYKYGSLMEEVERIQNVMEQYRVQAQKQEEIEANNRAHESTETVADKTGAQDSESFKAAPLTEENETAIATALSHDESEAGTVRDQTTASQKNDVDVDSDDIKQTDDPNAKPPDAALAAKADAGKVEGTIIDGHIDNGKTALD
ncbi:hypothetical protein AAHE18_12G235300 [Arachis hypogaea]